MERENGYYWIRVNGDWQIGYYTKDRVPAAVLVCEWETLTSNLCESDLQEIDERQIINPNI